MTEEGEIQFDNVLHDLASLPKPLAQGLGDTRDLCMNRYTFHKSNSKKIVTSIFNDVVKSANLLDCRTQDATLENLLSSGEFGASAGMGASSSSDEPCVPDVTPEEVSSEFFR